MGTWEIVAWVVVLTASIVGLLLRDRPPPSPLVALAVTFAVSLLMLILRLAHVSP
jgi:hypothetical protein